VSAEPSAKTSTRLRENEATLPRPKADVRIRASMIKYSQESIESAKVEPIAIGEEPE
jgi:hypothetical protein